MISVWLAFLAFVGFTSIIALPTNRVPASEPRALSKTDDLLLRPAVNSSSKILDSTNTVFGPPPNEPYCFTDAFIPIITPDDCLYTDHAIAHDPNFGPSISEPLTWTKGKRWRVRSCAIALVPNAQKPEDTFSRLEILTQAHRVMEKCEKAPHGFRGGFVGIGTDQFQLIVKRPAGHVTDGLLVSGAVH